jgi:uncharacterized protein YecE (DUF72 family)
MNLFLGCPIWAYKGWVGTFFPKGTKPADYLREYAQRLNTVEGNTTFYAVPSIDTLQRWVEDTPETFQFCPKLPRSVSHTGALVEHVPEAAQFVQIMSHLGPRLGPLFLQLPPSYSPAMLDDLGGFLAAWPHNSKLAVEVRHTRWFDSPHYESLNALLTKYSAARVVIDTRPIRSLQGDKLLQGSVYQRLLEARQRKPNLPIIPELTAEFVFLRYIGHPQLEQNAAILDEWSVHLAAWLREGRQTYVFCHCPDERIDPWLCRELHQRVANRIPLPPLPWQAPDSDTASQPQLF